MSNMEGLLPLQSKFPPHKDSEIKTPTSNQWERTKEGHDYVITSKGCGNGQNNNGFKNLFDLTYGKIAVSDIHTSVSTSKSSDCRGQVQIDTGRKVTKLIIFNQPKIQMVHLTCI